MPFIIELDCTHIITQVGKTDGLIHHTLSKGSATDQTFLKLLLEFILRLI